jgi:hypothetical protein
MDKQQRNAPKGQHHLAQGNALGCEMSKIITPCKGKIIRKALPWSL